MRSVAEQGFHLLIVSSNCNPGSPHWCVAKAISRSVSRARSSSIGRPSTTALVQ